MKILLKNNNINLLLNKEVDFKTDAGWSDSFSDFENDALEQVINPIENYETVRYINKPYSGITNNPNDLQTDIWFYFYFTDGINYKNSYESTGLSNRQNAKMTLVTNESFFRLEFYKTPNNESPDRSNRRLVATKILKPPLGEKFFLTKDNFNKYIHLPVFYGSNYSNLENMYFFWFLDDTVLDETTYSGNTFWMTARYFNSVDGNVIQFINNCKTPNDEINEIYDQYYKVIIDKSDFSYKIFNYFGSEGDRVGDKNNPISFYEVGGASNCNSLKPTATPTLTPTETTTTTLTPTITTTTTLTPTVTPTPPIVGDFTLSPSYGINITALSVTGGQNLPSFTFPSLSGTSQTLSMVQGYSAGSSLVVTLNGIRTPSLTLNVSLVKNSVNILSCQNITFNPSYQAFTLTLPTSVTINDSLRISVGLNSCI